jgi:hypothetical protein
LWNREEILQLLDEVLKIIEMMKSSNEFGLKLKLRVKETQSFYNFYLASCLFSIHMGPFLRLFTIMSPPYTLTYKVWVPFEYENNVLMFFAMALYQYTQPLILSLIVVAIDFLPIHFLNMGSGFLDELIIFVNDIDRAKNKTEKLKECLEIHVRVRQFLRKIQALFRVNILAHAAISCIILCTTAYTISKVRIIF